MNDKLTPVQAVRLLRGKAAELENVARQRLPNARDPYGVEYLSADVALIASLIADHMEQMAEEIEWLRRNETLVPIGDPLFNEDGTPWTARP